MRSSELKQGLKSLPARSYHHSIVRKSKAVLGSGLHPVKFGFHILYSGFPKEKFQDSRFHNQTFPGFLNLDSVSWSDYRYFKEPKNLVYNPALLWTNILPLNRLVLFENGTFQAVGWGRGFIKTTWNPQSVQKAGWSKNKVTVIFYLALLTSDVTTSGHWWPSGVRWSKLIGNEKLKLTVNSKEHNHPT